MTLLNAGTPARASGPVASWLLPMTSDTRLRVEKIVTQRAASNERRARPLKALGAVARHALVAEIEGLRKLGITIGKNLLISDCAHLVLPYHRLLDEQRELSQGRAKK